MDKQMLTDQISGLRSAIPALRAARDNHIKLGALTEQTEKARVERGELEKKLEELKKRKIELKTEKALSLVSVGKTIEAAITELLPNGEAVFNISEEGVFIALKHHGDKVTPYLSLSGGEKAFYDAALSNALLGKSKAKILAVEAAEIDEEKLSLILQEIVETKPDAQVILSSCHRPSRIPKGWEVNELG